jgi:hypothetical protein
LAILQAHAGARAGGGQALRQGGKAWLAARAWIGRGSIWGIGYNSGGGFADDPSGGFADDPSGGFADYPSGGFADDPSGGFADGKQVRRGETRFPPQRRLYPPRYWPFHFGSPRDVASGRQPPEAWCHGRMARKRIWRRTAT